MSTRRKFISEMVEKYKTDFPEDYAGFLRLMEHPRNNMSDKNLGTLKGAKEMRVVGNIPVKLENVLSYAMSGNTVERFLEPKGEQAWFFKKYPEFLLPRSY